MERDAVQSAVTADFRCHRADRVCGARAGVDAPELARATGHPGRSVRSKGHFHGFADHLRTGDGFDAEACGEAHLGQGGRRERQGGDDSREDVSAVRHNVRGTSKHWRANGSEATPAVGS